MAVSRKRNRMIDGDGHIFEDMRSIMQRVPEVLLSPSIRLLGIFPQLDNLHTASYVSPPGSFQDPGVEGWTSFLDENGFDATVVYPTAGLGFCRLIDVDLAIAGARAYNDWLFETYMSGDKRVNGVALLPMQEPDAAAEELERAVTKLGMRAAMLPPTGLKSLLGAKEYSPVYEVANRLGCALGVHGGAHQDLGMNHESIFAATHSVGHPFAISSQFVDLLFTGTFEKFPNVRWGFLEGGVAWFLMMMERCPGSHHGFSPVDLGKRYLQLGNESMDAYLRRLIKEGRIFVGVEGDEPALAFAVEQYGSEPFIFSSDFPHEVNQETIREEIEGLESNENLSEDAKDAILFGNAEKFYRLGVSK